jgi:8-oxo-dGTP pyrophosphatase MutT (NUDIX family)
MQAQEPNSDFWVWFAPGGGRELQESAEACLRREICEETGLEGFEMGPLIWRRNHVFEWGGQMLSQHEEFYLVRATEFEPYVQGNPSEAELAVFRQFRWWAVDEIAASQEVFAPRALARHLESLMQEGPPAEPIDVGV